MANPTTDSKMYETMHAQPAALQNLIDTGWDAAAQSADLIANSKRIIITGVGTSYHAALAGGWLLRAAGRDARAIISADLTLYPDSFAIRPTDAVIVMAHSGIKTVTAQAMRVAIEAGATVISVGSLTAEHPGSQLILRTVEREKSAAFTASHTAAMTVLAQIATELGDRDRSPATADFREALTALPDQVAGVLDRQAEIEPIAAEAVHRRVYAAGAGPNEVTALELVIKCREAALGDVDALALEQFLHGPIVSTSPEDLGVLINIGHIAATRTAEIATMLSRLGTRLWIVGNPVDDLPAATTFALPQIPEILSPILATVPMQILAYQMAARKGVHPDTFRRDDPIFNEALNVLKL